MRRWYFSGCFSGTKIWKSYDLLHYPQTQAFVKAQYDRQFATLVAWGLNDRGQCGVSSHSPLLSGPEEVVLKGVPINATEALSAGPTHAAIATSRGEVYAWGDGAHGKLGLGSNRLGSFLPARIEALVGRAHITHLALGQRWTLLLGKNGELYATGRFATEELEYSMRQRLPGQNILLKDFTNKSSHHGLHDTMVPSGTPLGDGFFELSSPQALGKAVGTAFQSSLRRSQSPLETGGEVASGGISSQLLPFIDHSQRLEDIFYTRQIKGSGKGMEERDWLTEGDRLSSSAYPIVGKKLSDPFHWSLESPLPFLINNPTTEAHRATHCQSISIAPSSAGSRVCGLDSNGLLTVVNLIQSNDGDTELSTSAMDLGLVNQVLEKNGGAISLVSCEGFDAAVTKCGRVVVWKEKTSGSIDGDQLKGKSKEIDVGNQRYQIHTHSSAGVQIVEYVFLEHKKHIKIKMMSGSGNSLLMSDGECVWSLDIALPKDNLNVGLPRQEVRLGEEGVARVSAGNECFAIVSEAGRLWTWGKLLTNDRIASAVRCAESEGFGHWAYSAGDESLFGAQGVTDVLQKHQNNWPGFGSPRPTVVPGLHNVSNVALGYGYALAIVA